MALPTFPTLRAAPAACMLLAVGAFALVPDAHAAQATAQASIACPGDTARVRGASAADLADLCAGVAASLAFLSRHGVQATEPVDIEVTPRLPEGASPSAAGCYIAERRRVYVVPFERFRRHGTWFGVPIDRRLYRALASHEAAHAVLACHFRIPNPTIQAQEYLAYVTLFGVMPDALRQQALRRVRTTGFDSLDRFTPVLYSFDPMRFGAEAWRHFSAAADPAGLIQDILAGRQMRD